MSGAHLSRRSLLKGSGALVVSFSIAGATRRTGRAATIPIPANPAFDGPAQLELTPELDSWIRIDEDGGVTYFTGRVEIGNGIITALNQIVAEELSVPFDRVSVVSGDTDVVPNQGITSATTTIGVAANVIRTAATTARRALLDLAATDLEVDVAALTITDGVVSVSEDATRQRSYGELIGGKAFNLQVDAEVQTKPVAEYTIVGQPIQRVDIPRKLTGSTGDFNENHRVPGMRFARILRAPAYGARLVSYDETVAGMPGIVAVLPFKFPGDERLDRVERLETMAGDFVAVIAEREDLAIRGVAKLQETVTWEMGESLPATSETVYDWLAENGKPIGIQDDYDHRLSDYQAAVKQLDQTLSATYQGPYLHYGPISSAWSLADVREDRATIWSATQWPFGARWMVAQALGFEKAEQVQVMGGSSSGLYGRRDDYDQEVDVEAALLSQAIGAPVRLQWSRPEEFVWSQYRPPQIVTLEAGLDTAGHVQGLSGRVWTTVRGVHPMPVISTMALAETPYQLGPMPLEGYDAGPLLRTGYMRNVFSGYNIFALESFMDELASLAETDPVEFRLRHLQDERATAVIDAVTKQAGWEPHAGVSGRGMGISFVLYTNKEGPSATYLAYVAEVEVDEESGKVQVKKMTCAIDPGLVINPDGVRNQVEGGVIQATSWCMKEQVTFDTSIVTSRDWASYRILTFPEVPEIDVVIVDRPDQPSKGIGEPVTVPVASAIANAIFDATGARIRELPMTPDHILAALAAR